MLKQTEGSHAVAEAIALCRPQVICAYPITPQTHIVEGLGEMVKSGELQHCEFINVESEFAALSVAIGASAAGARTFTANAGHGILSVAPPVCEGPSGSRCSMARILFRSARWSGRTRSSRCATCSTTSKAARLI